MIREEEEMRGRERGDERRCDKRRIGSERGEKERQCIKVKEASQRLIRSERTLLPIRLERRGKGRGGGGGPHAGELVVCPGEALEEDRELDVARANNILDLELLQDGKAKARGRWGRRVGAVRKNRDKQKRSS